ncbi:hypothetical protein [Gordonia sihwensis]|uniref:hypothetical protein n=1 Tax=Gordonia sihwensis TaxID=173559 RepID=UPI0005F06B94|nr:hypothetical protein [Gordonia sihwensis]KJR10579.1 hypothetical protein UG54_00905 [Gordonia sihwensis]
MFGLYNGLGDNERLIAAYDTAAEAISAQDAIADCVLEEVPGGSVDVRAQSDTDRSVYVLNHAGHRLGYVNVRAMRANTSTTRKV